MLCDANVELALKTAIPKSLVMAKAKQVAPSASMAPAVKSEKKEKGAGKGKKKGVMLAMFRPRSGWGPVMMPSVFFGIEVVSERVALHQNLQHAFHMNCPWLS